MGKCSQVGLQSPLGMKSGQTARGLLHNAAGTSHLPLHSVPAPSADLRGDASHRSCPRPLPSGGEAARGAQGEMEANSWPGGSALGQPGGSCRRGEAAGPGMGGPDPALQSEPF